MSSPPDIVADNCPSNSLGEKEVAARRAAVVQAEAHHRIEGLIGQSELSARLEQDWIYGRKTADECVAALVAHYRVDGGRS